jgi:hypothetical protein
MSKSTSPPLDLEAAIAAVLRKLIEDNKLAPAPASALPTSSTFDQFRKRHNLGRTLFYELLAAGKGPKVIRIGAHGRITSEDERAWLDQLRAEAGGGAK